MQDQKHPAPPLLHRVGRPRRGTAAERTDTLIHAATRVFLREGYGSASIDKVASEAGVSTRTIYERYKNKADLLAAVITRLVERDMATVLATAELERLEPREALTIMGRTMTRRMCDPDSAALFRIVATEAQRFPDLAAKMRDCTKSRVDRSIGNYFRGQIMRGKLALADPDRAACLFIQMICGEVQECLLFRGPEAIGQIDLNAHVKQVVDIFLFGAAARADRPTQDGSNL